MEKDKQQTMEKEGAESDKYPEVWENSLGEVWLIKGCTEA